MFLLFLLQRDALNLEPSNVANCVSKGKSEVSIVFLLRVRFLFTALYPRSTSRARAAAVFEKNFNSGTVAKHGTELARASCNGHAKESRLQNEGKEGEDIGRNVEEESSRQSGTGVLK